MIDTSEQDPVTISGDLRSHSLAIRASAIIGGSQLVSIAMGLVRTKLAALVLGPGGIGLIGLLQTLLQTASNLAAFGIGTAGTRQVAESNATPGRDRVVRRALATATFGCALIGAVATLALRRPIASWALGNERLAPVVAWLALGVFLTVVTMGQNALLIGLRRIGDAARQNVISSIAAAVIGVAAIAVWGQDGLVLFVLAVPIATAVVGHFLIRRIASPNLTQASDATVAKEMRALLRLGTAFVVAGVATSLSQLAFRSIINQSLGGAALGHFQAAWFVSMTYVAFVLQAMGADYYPRLTAAIARGDRPGRLVQEQAEVALLLAAPVLLGTLAAAPFVIWLLYSSAFAPATGILRWQILADVLKVASFPLGYLLLAQGRSWTFMTLEVATNLVMVAALWLLLPRFGIEASGIAVLVCYVFYLGVVTAAVWRGAGLSAMSPVVRLFAGLLAAAVATTVAAWADEWAGLAVGVTLAILFGLAALHRLEHALPSFVARFNRMLRRRG